jgi:hypothetical protein
VYYLATVVSGAHQFLHGVNTPQYNKVEEAKAETQNIVKDSQAREYKGLVVAYSWKNTIIEEAQIKKQKKMQLRCVSITEI